MLHQQIIAARPPGAIPAWDRAYPLSRLERQVVLLSFTDDRRSVRRTAPALAVFKRWLGRRPRNRLADPRLEALRRFAVLYRITGDRADAEPLQRHGYAADAIEAVRMMVAQSDPPGVARTSRLAAGVMIVLAAILIGAWLQSIVEDPFIVLIMLGLLATILLSWMSGRGPRS